jgi:hypothetical protein
MVVSLHQRRVEGEQVEKDLGAGKLHDRDRGQVSGRECRGEAGGYHAQTRGPFLEHVVSAEVAWAREHGIERHSHLAVCNARGFVVDLAACEQQAKTGGVVVSGNGSGFLVDHLVDSVVPTFEIDADVVLNVSEREVVDHVTQLCREAEKAGLGRSLDRVS